MEDKAAVEFNAVDNAVNKPYDGDGDGNLSDVEKACKKYDTNGDGVFSLLEVEAVVRDMKEAEKEAKNMGKLAIAVAIVGVLLCGVLLGLMFAANEASKESHVKGSVLVDLSGNPTQTKPVSSVVTLVDLPKLTTKQLDEVKFVSFTAYRTKNNANLPIPREESVEEFGEANIRINVDGYVKTNAAVTLETAKGPLVISNNGSPPQYNDYRVIITEPTRRLSEEHGNQARFYSSVDELLSHERRHGRHLTDDGHYGIVQTSFCGIVCTTTSASGTVQISANVQFTVQNDPSFFAVVPAELIVSLSFTAGYTPETFGGPQRFVTGEILREAANCGRECEVALEVYPASSSSSSSSSPSSYDGIKVVATLSFANMEKAKAAKEEESVGFFLPRSPLFAKRFKEKIEDLPFQGFDVYQTAFVQSKQAHDPNGYSPAIPIPSVGSKWVIAPAITTYPTTPKPSGSPTPYPTPHPTRAPTKAPTKAPTLAPTEAPTKAPTLAPTKAPTTAPTLAPTEAPTKAPTLAPTKAPTKTPTFPPAGASTAAPTKAATAVCSACIVAYLNSTEAAASSYSYATGSYV